MPIASPNSTNEIQAGQIAKGVSILAVVFLHTLSAFPATIYTSGSFRFVFIFLNQAARFSVPLFLALSGFGLSRKYQKQKLHIPKYLKRKIRKLLPLYLLWSLILIVIFKISHTWQKGDIDIWNSLLFGKTDYHLYYVPLIFQLYLLFLFLPKLKRLRYHLFLVLVFGLFQALWFYLVRLSSLQQLDLNKILLSDQIQYRFLNNWIFYFIFGIFTSRLNISWVQSFKWLKYLFVTIIIGGLFWAVYDALFLINSTGNIIYSTSFIRLPVLIYSTGVISVTLIYGRQLTKFIQSVRTALLFIGKHSYTIYLSHTLALRIIESVLTQDQPWLTLFAATVLLLGGITLGNKYLSPLS